MPPIPPIAPKLGAAPEPDMESDEKEMAGVEPSGTKIAVKCAALDCRFNKGGYCNAPEISVSAGPEVSCETYEPKGGLGGPGAGAPMPPMPPMMPDMMGGAMA